ncbi:hypothetical protein T11_8769 [Trichinella zimbabwensis]|uniref:Uncharacterized protein n=1 Tax=Trichinella zimbabwensis TaxID=268475 RepID=A0A0V1GNS9_9BILA|nr:hypothetical protein T11_9920 [Trichinella zimbabwensis]KRY99951.1 hypothetical protein T11_8769 [Trichinella zimbabwensis]
MGWRAGIQSFEVWKFGIRNATKFYNECRILGFRVVDGYASGYAACRLISTCHLRSFAPSDDL